MGTIIPWLATFSLGLLGFAAGLYLQKAERAKRLESRLRAQAHAGEPSVLNALREPGPAQPSIGSYTVKKPKIQQTPVIH